jgi:hypothetical protein
MRCRSCVLRLYLAPGKRWFSWFDQNSRVVFRALVQTRGWRVMMKRCNGSSRIEDLFKGLHFDRQVIVLCVSWYASFKLSLRDLVNHDGGSWRTDETYII